MAGPQGDLQIAFRLPKPGWPRALFASNYSYNGGELWVNDRTVLRARDRGELERGLTGELPGLSVTVAMRLDTQGEAPVLRVLTDVGEAPREADLHAPPSRSAWLHAIIALLASFAGFVAGFLYFLKAQNLESAWALKMSYHTLGWHLLLTFTLFPASVWGQRVGIRSVQVVSLLFFFIHVGIAIANVGPSDPNNPDDPWIALLNAVSGVLFLVSTVYGQIAHRDMDPLRALGRNS